MISALLARKIFGSYIVLVSGFFILPCIADATTETFNYTGNIQAWTVPADAYSVVISAVGAAGGSAQGTVHGGYAGAATGTLTVTASTTYYIYVGAIATTSVGAWPGGGNSGNTSNLNNHGGGGFTAFSATNTLDQSTIILLAAGGGAANTSGHNQGYGDGGGLVGGLGRHGNSTCTPGGGGTQSAGGAAGAGCSGGTSGQAGSALQGGNGPNGTSNDGPGGGGGYFGGGSGGSSNGAGQADAGGGGSSFISSTLTSTSAASSTNTGDGFLTLTYSSSSSATPTITDPKQYRSDGTTELGEGSSTEESVVVFRAYLNSSSSNQLKLQVEISTSTSFTNVLTATSTVVSPQNYAAASSTNLADGTYYWRARALDTATNATSSWEEFGTPGVADFMINATWRTETFNYTGAVQSWTVPTDVYSVIISAVGVAGGSAQGTVHGGYAGAATGTLAVTAGTTYHIFVGAVATSSVGAWPGGGSSGNTSSLSNHGGGGFTAMGLAPAFTQNNLLLVAAGGGAANTSGHNQGYGDGGGLVGGLGRHGNSTCTPGGGGTQSAGGVAGSGCSGGSNGNAGSALQGGNGPNGTSNDGPGGGGGYFGGGSGGSSNGAGQADAGGGGSSFISSTLTSTSVASTTNTGDGFLTLTYSTALGIAPGTLNQYKSDAVTPIGGGATTTESTAVFGATLQNPSSGTVQLQVEVQPAGTNFTDTPNASSSFVPSGSSTTAIFIDSDAIDPTVYPRDPESWSNGNFHWQARVKDQNGATSTWQTFGTSTGATDFKINTVPLYTQKISPWPSTASTTSWGGDTYFNGTSTCGSTISNCGCVITSIVMWMRYYGITTDKYGNDINPKGLDDWLTSVGGYNSSGSLIWAYIEDYASSTSGSIIFDDNSLSYDDATSSIPFYLASSSVLGSDDPNPALIKEIPDNHWLLATGFAKNSGTSTYTVRDPFWHSTQYLNQSETTSTINNYDNNMDAVRVYKDPVNPPRAYEYHVNSPNTFIFVDPQGRRTGKDPITGVVYREIPGVGYGSGQLGFRGLPDGEYTLYVLGGEAGSYWISAYRQGTIDANIQKGAMDVYKIIINSANAKDSGKLIFQGTDSSTASITAESPHNLPLAMPSPPTSQPSPALPIPILVPTSTSTPTSTINLGARSYMATSSTSSATSSGLR